MKKQILFLTVLFLAFGTIGLAQTTLDGLVGYWKFDEGTGTTVSDELGTTNGELVNAVEAIWADGYMGKALDFSQTDGNPAYARFAGDGATDLTENFTFMFWIKADMTIDHEQSIISKGVPYLETGGIDGGWFHTSLKDGAVRFMVWDGTNFSSPGGTLPFVGDPSTWYHIACVRDMTTAKIYTYVNGELLDGDAGTADDANVPSALHTNEDLTFGSVANGVQTTTRAADNSTVSPDGSPFWPSNYTGMLDEVQLYNVALSAAQIKSVYDGYTSTAIDSKQVDKLQISLSSANNVLVLYNAEKLSKVEVFSLTGRLVKTATTSMAPSVSLDVSDLSKGTYIVKAYGTDYSVAATKFVKQ